jgi:ATP-binding cassette, subfamily B, bacterial
MKFSYKSFFIQMLKPMRWHLLGFFIVDLLWSLDLSFRPYLIKMMLDRIDTTEPGAIFQAIGLIAAVYILISLAMSLIFRVWNIIRRNLVPRLKGNITEFMMQRMFKHSYTYYQNNFAGSLANKINDVSYGVPQVVEITFDSFIANFMAIIIAMMVIFTVRPMICLMFFIWITLFLWGSYYFAKKAHYLSDRASELRSQLTGKIVDILGNMNVVRLFANRRLETSHIKTWTGETVVAERAFDWVLIKMFAFQSLSFVVLQAATLIYLIYSREYALITIGDFALVLTINIYIVDNLWNIGHQFTQFSEQLGKVSQGLGIIFHDHEVKDRPDAGLLKIKKGQVEFKDVVFEYQKGTPLFQHLNVTIKAGESVGLVGYSGSGKTTFANLILRLFDVQSGVILIDEQDIKAVTQDSLRAQISLIPQDPTLFHRSLMENIRYGYLEATDQQVINAAKKAHAHEFIMKLPEGYQSLVGERGIKLSGGQRQRIAIARAILKNAPILLLDEATSALDSVTEAFIQKSLLALMQKRTTLVIAHRLSTLLHMDRILVFDQGKIIEEGSHRELLEQNGFYARLWQAQIGGLLPTIGATEEL